jgi:hypothetical protein
VPARPPGRLRRRPGRHGGSGRRRDPRRDLQGRPERRDRLLLRLSHRVERSGRQQRHDPGPAGKGRRRPAVRPLRPGLQAVRPQLPPGDDRRPAQGDDGPGLEWRRRAGLCRRAGRLEGLPGPRQPRPRRRADRPLAGLAHPAEADRRGDRRQAGPEATGLGPDPGHEHAGGSGHGPLRLAAPVPPGRPGRLRDLLRLVPRRQPAAGRQQVLRQGDRAWQARGLRQPGGPGRRLGPAEELFQRPHHHGYGHAPGHRLGPGRGGQDALHRAAGPGLGAVRAQRRLRLPGRHGPPRQGRPPHRQHPRRPAGDGRSGEGLGPAPGGRQPGHGGSGRRGGGTGELDAPSVTMRIRIAPPPPLCG